MRPSPAAVATPAASAIGTRMNEQALRSRLTRGSCLQATEFLNLSHMGVVTIQSLSLCPKLRTLWLHYNNIESVSSAIQQCPQLWHIDLSHNKIFNLDGFERFVAIGELNLAYNNITWQELGKLRHLTVLHLRLHGNPQLERDPYYRIHVIDCLPNIWFLDGRLVTSAERVQTQNFFRDSAFSSRPVRHKLPTEVSFVPSSLKELLVNGVFGRMATELLMQFPMHGPSNVDMDERKLKFYARNLVEDMKLEKKYNQRRHQVLQLNDTFMDELLASRKDEPQRGNMLILLLIASLEFSLPISLLKDTLELAKLDYIGRVCCLDLFMSPKETCSLVACVLMASAKIERIDKKTGGLYDRLYLALNFILATLVKGDASPQSKTQDVTYRQYRSLLAAEVVQLMCIVPAFFEYVQKEPGVMELTVTATGDNSIAQKLSQLTARLQESGHVDDTTILKGSARLILVSVQQNLNLGRGDVKGDPVLDMLVCRSPPIKRPMSGPVYTSAFHAQGRSSPDSRPPRVSSSRASGRSRTPRIGDRILVAPQSVARIVSLPQADLALIQIEQLSVNGSTISKGIQPADQYLYADVKNLVWDTGQGSWRFKEANGDRFNFNASGNNELSFPREIKLPSAAEPKSDVGNDPETTSSPATALQGQGPTKTAAGDTDTESSRCPPDRLKEGHLTTAEDTSAATPESRMQASGSNSAASAELSAAEANPEASSAAPHGAAHGAAPNELSGNSYASPVTARTFLNVTLPQRELSLETEAPVASKVIKATAYEHSHVVGRIGKSYFGTGTGVGGFTNRPHPASPGRPASASPRVAGLQGLFSRSPRPVSAAEAFSIARRQASRSRPPSSASTAWASNVRIGSHSHRHDVHDDTWPVDEEGRGSPSSTHSPMQTSTCYWLGNGRDLYREELTKRQKGMHIPGYKEGELRRPSSRLNGMLLHRCNRSAHGQSSYVRGVSCPECSERLYV